VGTTAGNLANKASSWLLAGYLLADLVGGRCNPSDIPRAPASRMLKSFRVQLLLFYNVYHKILLRVLITLYIC
jgi:hypothetical protein